MVDNCEHVLDAAARLVTAVVEAAPGCGCWPPAGSRCRCPASTCCPCRRWSCHRRRRGTPDRLRQNEAVVLFTQRAAAASGTFELTDANRAAVVGVCRRLDGLPLAIELAAVRTRVLSVEQILEHLTDRFGLLTGGPGRVATPSDPAHRHRLEPRPAVSRRAQFLRRLSVFAGRFTLDDVEGVCAGDGPARHAGPGPAVVAGRQVPGRHRGRQGGRLLPPARDDARVRRLRLREAGEEDLLARRCAEYYLARCRRFAAEPAPPGRVAGLARPGDRQHPRRPGGVPGPGGLPRGLELAASLGWYWVTRATTEGVRWLDQFLAARPTGTRSTPRRCSCGGSWPCCGPTRPRPADLAVRPPPPAAGPRRNCWPNRWRWPRSPRTWPVIAPRAAAARRGTSGRRRPGRPARPAGPAPGRGDRRVLPRRPRGVPLRLRRRRAAEPGRRRPVHARDLADEPRLRRTDAPGTRRPRAAAHRSAADRRRIDDRVAQFYLVGALGCHAAASGEPRLAHPARRLRKPARRDRGQVNAILAPLLPRATAAASRSRPLDLRRRVHGRHASPGTPRSDSPSANQRTSPRTVAATGPHHSPAGGRGRAPGRRRPDQQADRHPLFISERTVENHVHNIMNKLGFSSRAQIAGWIAAPDLTA